MKKYLKIIGLVLLGVFLVIQLFRPDRTNPVSDPAKLVWADSTVPKDIAATFKRSCSDCNSNETRWPWYSNVAPVSWLVAGDVNDARGRVNFSTWLDYSDRKREKMRGNIAEEVESGGMPLGKYTFVHSDAKLSPEEVKAIVAWGGK